MGKYVSPRSELWSSLEEIRDRVPQESHSSSDTEDLAREVSDVGHLMAYQDSKDADDFNQYLRQKRQGRNG